MMRIEPRLTATHCGNESFVGAALGRFSSSLARYAKNRLQILVSKMNFSG
jgi:hypothetical protein